ncbi:MAG: hypothetical protein ACR2FM_00850 [Candidatus Saccharimonadales bacterium]
MAEKDKLFDVARPGKTPAGATSRPIIVGHASTMKRDPMVMGEVSDETKPTEAEATRTPILVLEVPTDSKTDEAKSDETQTDTPFKDEAEESPAEEQPVEVAKETTSSPVVDTLVEEVSAKQEDKRRAQAQEAQSTEIENSIAAKEFFVPIGVESRRRSDLRIIIVSLLLIIVTFAGLNFGLDAELLDIGVKPLTDVL